VAVAPPLPGPRPEIPPLVWDDELRGRLRVWAAQGASPSALNTLFTCERNFLYSYLFRLREPRELEEQMAASTFGSIVHYVLEHGLHDARGRVVTRADLQSILDRLPALLRAAAIKEFNEAFTESGENFLSLVLAEATVRKLVKQEMLEIDEGAVRTLESLESEIHRTIEGPAALGPLKLRGKADRIEREGGLLRIVDYKTGKVEQREVDLKAGWQETLFEGKKSKAVQLLAYCAMSEESPVQAAIRSGRAARSGLLQLRVEKNALIEAGHVREFIDLLGTALTERLEEGRTAAHAHDAKYCPYCVELNPEPEWG
jgi:RecB family exonuclease